MGSLYIPTDILPFHLLCTLPNICRNNPSSRSFAHDWLFDPLPAQCLPHPFGDSRFFLMTITFYTLMIMFSQFVAQFVFKSYHKTCEQFYRHFGIYEKSPNSSSKMNSSFKAQLLACFNTSHRLFSIIG